MKSAILTLLALLLASNAYWAYKLLDAGISLSYRDSQIKDMKKYDEELENFIIALAKNRTKKEIIMIAKNSSGKEAYRKKGCVWVGEVGFKFDKSGKLKTVEPTWSFGKDSECLKSSNNQIN